MKHKNMPKSMGKINFSLKFSLYVNIFSASLLKTGAKSDIMYYSISNQIDDVVGVKKKFEIKMQKYCFVIFEAPKYKWKLKFI